MSMTKQEIADEIMSYMTRQKAKPNHAFSTQQLYYSLFRNLNPKEQDLLQPAIESLVEKQFVAVEDRHGECLVLTQQGYEQLYPLSAGVNEQLGQLIMQQFAKQHSRPNHTLDYRNLQFHLVSKLNPKEIELLPDAIQTLVTKGWVTVENRYGECLVLTQQGYDTLY